MSSGNDDSRVECPRLELVDAYVAGRLERAEARAFEAHYFACEVCWSELERVTAVKAAFLDEGAVAPPRSKRRGLALALSTAAALIILSVTAVVWNSRPSEEKRAFRGGVTSIELTVRVSAEDFVAEWPEVPEAASYRVQAFDAEGRSLFETETKANRLVVTRQEVRNPSAARYWRVQALDKLRRSIADSPLTALEPPS